MRLVVLSTAFCVLRQAAPLPSPDETTDDLAWRKDGIDIEFTPERHRIEYDFDYEDEDWEYDFDYDEEYHEYDVDFDQEHRGYEFDYDEEDAGYGMSYLNAEDDRAFAPIFQHVADILESRTSAREQLERILDAIVHHPESVPEIGAKKEEGSPSSDQVLGEISRILDSGERSEEKISLIFTEITSNTKHNGKVEFSPEDPDNAVLGRLQWILDGPDSAQKRIQMMLNELADHLHPENDSSKKESSVDTDVQRTLPLHAIIDETDQDITADILEDVDKEYNTRYGF